MSHFDKFLVKIDVRKKLINKKAATAWTVAACIMRSE